MIRWTGLAPWEFEFPFPETGVDLVDEVPVPEVVQLVGPVWGLGVYNQFKNNHFAEM